MGESSELRLLAAQVNNQVLVVHAGIPGPRPRVWLPGQTHDPEALGRKAFLSLGCCWAATRTRKS